MTIVFPQAENLWNAIQHEANPSGKRFKMVEFAKLLLKHAAMDEADIQRMSETDELTDFFIEYLDSANLAVAFFDRALPYLEPELKASEFEIQIQDTKDYLSKVLEESENLGRSNAKLLEHKARLQAESRGLTALEAELDELRHLEERLKPENIAALEEELRILKENTQAKQPELERMEEEQARLQEVCQHVEGMLQALQETRSRSFEHLTDLSGKLAASLDHAWDECDLQLSRELRKLNQKNKMFHEVTKKLHDCLKELQQVVEAEKVNREIYERHFAANTEIANVSQHGIGQSREASALNDRDRISGLSKQIGENLEQFDKELKKILEANEASVTRIRRLNMTG